MQIAVSLRRTLLGWRRRGGPRAAERGIRTMRLLSMAGQRPALRCPYCCAASVRQLPPPDERVTRRGAIRAADKSVRDSAARRLH